MTETITPPAPPAETAKVTLPGGVIVDMPKADAEKVIQAQQKANEERDALARKAGAAEAVSKAAQEQAARDAADKEAIKLATGGEIEKARAIFSAEATTKLGTLSARLKDQEIVSAIRRAAPHLDDRAVGDMKSLIASRAAFNADTGTVIFNGDDGKPLLKDGNPVGADAYLTEFLSTRTHFQAAKTPSANGGGGGQPQVTGTITLKDLVNASKEVVAGVTAGRIKVVE